MKFHHTAGHGYERGDTAEEILRGGGYREVIIIVKGSRGMSKEREQAEALLEGESRGYARVGDAEVRKPNDLIERLRDAECRNGFAIILKQEVDEAADALAQCRAENERLQAFLLSSSHRQEYERLRGEVERLRLQRDLARADDPDWEASVDAMKSELSSLRAEVERIKGIDHMAEILSENEALRAEVERLKQDKPKWIREYTEKLEARVAELEALIKQYEAIPVEDMEEEIATLRAEVERLETKHGKLENESGVSILRERIAELEGALEKIADAGPHKFQVPHGTLDHCQAIARAALERKP